ncbi:hypothetical protein N431DRAFT_479574 [Stipitochalara longipes BDJ]|nr:hypothetical protein N431DRAFT_479574 [Stipitochalara longipes BDJ]
MKPKLAWSYKTYANRFRDWLFHVEPLAAREYGQRSRNLLSTGTGALTSQPCDFALVQSMQQKAFQILGRAAFDPSYVDPHTGDNVLHALSRIQLDSTTTLLSKIKIFVSKDVDLNLHNRDQYTPLATFITERPFEAHENGIKLSKYLDALLWKDSHCRIPNRINVNMRNREGTTALYHAAIRGRPDSVRSLVDAGANVNATIVDDSRRRISILQAVMNAKAMAVLKKDDLLIHQFDNVIAYLQHGNAVENPMLTQERMVFDDMLKVMPM